MTNQEINIAIAESCGWTRAGLGTQSKYDEKWRGWLPPNVKGDWRYAVGSTPCYVADLNAMHEAEKTIARIKIPRYISEIWTAMCREGNAEELDIGTIHATARHRAEAFLRTIDKMEGSD